MEWAVRQLHCVTTAIKILKSHHVMCHHAELINSSSRSSLLRKYKKVKALYLQRFLNILLVKKRYLHLLWIKKCKNKDTRPSLYWRLKIKKVKSPLRENVERRTKDSDSIIWNRCDIIPRRFHYVDNSGAPTERILTFRKQRIVWTQLMEIAKTSKKIK